MAGEEFVQLQKDVKSIAADLVLAKNTIWWLKIGVGVALFLGIVTLVSSNEDKKRRY